MTVQCGDRTESALVDVAINTTDVVGSGALWDPAAIAELFLCFAEPTAVGLSAIGAHLRPTPRRAGPGLAIALGQPAAATIRPPIAPGLIAAIDVRSVAALQFDSPVVAETISGVVSIDGERLFRFRPPDRPTITLQTDGPVMVDVAATLEHAARRRFSSSPIERCA